MRRAAAALAACGAVVAIDQGAKALARAVLGEGDAVHLLLGFRLDLVHNSGAAFGLFAGSAAALAAVSALAVAAIGAYVVRHAASRTAWAAGALIAGGALGNLADRLRDGAVTDFIDPPAWPAFNVADVAIVAGVAIVLLGILREQA